MKKAISLLVFLTSLSQLCYGVSEEERRATWDKLRQIKEQTSLTLHPQQGEVTKGANLVEPGNDLSVHFSEIYLLRIVDPEDNEIYKLHITALYMSQQWANYSKVREKDGSAMSLTVLSRLEPSNKLSAGKKEEQLEVNMGIEDLANHLGQGLDIVLSGETDEQNIHIPSIYLLAMMQSM
ncbi:MAG: hypothetical protein R3E57_00490 [Porticoccaceae bacterium]